MFNHPARSLIANPLMARRRARRTMLIALGCAFGAALIGLLAGQALTPTVVALSKIAPPLEATEAPQATPAPQAPHKNVRVIAIHNTTPNRL